MISELYRKEYSNQAFFLELQQKQKDEQWLKEGLESRSIDIDHQDENGDTFLINCLKAGKFQSVEWLIKHGADVTIKNKESKSAIHVAIEKNSLPVVKGLLELNKININETNTDGRTLLQNKITFENQQMAKLLILQGINIHNLDNNGENILFALINDGTKHLELIKLLLSYSIDPNTKNYKGKNVYEILNGIILDLYETKSFNEGKEYLLILEILLQYDTHSDHNYLDSKKNPLFFDPFFYGHHELFNLYIKYSFDIQMKNDSGHNIFFEYLLQAFEEEDHSESGLKNFEKNLIELVIHKVDYNLQDDIGWTILQKVVQGKCHNELFDILVKIVPFDYTLQDTLGRTIIHNAVWSDHEYVIQRVHGIDVDILNTSDSYNILPITYAALLGNQKLVLLFLELGSLISTYKKIPKPAVEKFSPMLKNLSKLSHGIDAVDQKTSIEALKQQILHDFDLEKISS